VRVPSSFSSSIRKPEIIPKIMGTRRATTPGRDGAPNGGRDGLGRHVLPRAERRDADPLEDAGVSLKQHYRRHEQKARDGRVAEYD